MKSRLLATVALAVLATAPVALAQTVVPADHFKSIELRGGGHVTLRYGAVQRVTLTEGSTQYTTVKVGDDGKLVIDACNNDCPMHYDLEIEIVTPEVGGVAVSGGGAIESAGGFPHQDSVSAAVEGGGRIDLRTVDAASANAAVDGGGKILVKAERSLMAAVDGGGSITYWGDPAVSSAIDGGGSVRKGS
jgi:hypothetical protein